MKALFLAGSLLVASTAVLAQSSPVGLWKTIDDETKKPKSHVRISEAGGVLSGKIEELINPSKPNPVCEACSGDKKDQPVVGMTIIEGVKHNADDQALWDGGEILDPNNGKTYKVRLTPIEGGQKLEVRGYIGMPLLGRTQTWIRVQ